MTLDRHAIYVGDRLGLTREEAAYYIHVAIPTFNRLVAEGLMPPAKIIGNRHVWDRRAIEMAFSNLPDAGSADAAQGRVKDEWD